MNRYYVKMDGQEMPKSYTYQELKDLGIFEFDDIQIRKTLDNTWYLAKYYSFPEVPLYSSQSYHVDEYGQIHNDLASSQSDYTIDESGQTSSLGSPSSSSYSSSSSSYYNSGNSDTDFWGGLWTFIKIVITIAIIGFLIFAFSNDIKIGSGVLVASCFILKKLWDDD